MEHSLNSLEVAYFLPQSNSRQGEFWLQKKGMTDESQLLYAECCIHGMNRIAQMVHQYAQQGSSTPLLEGLYDVGAEVRRDTAILMRKPEKSFMLYGHYAIMPDHRLIDLIGNVVDKSQFIKHCESLVKDLHTDKRAVLGDDYNFQLEDHGSIKFLTFDYCGGLTESFRVAKIKYSSEINKANDAILGHVSIENQKHIFTIGDDHLMRAIEARKTDSAECLKQLLLTQKALFHAAPLRLGSQTTTLMVVGGIMKGLGFKVVPQKNIFDPYIDAEIMPYTQYPDLSRFSELPKIIYSPKDLDDLRTEDNFFENRGIRRSIISDERADELVTENERLTWFLRKIVGIPEDFNIASIRRSPKHICVSFKLSNELIHGSFDKTIGREQMERDFTSFVNNRLKAKISVQRLVEELNLPRNVEIGR